MSLMNLASRRSWNFGSGRILRLATSRRRGMFWSSPCDSGRPLGAVLAAALLAAGDADGVERAANDVVAHAGQVLDPASAGHRGRLALVDDLLAPLADELANRRHQYLSTRPPPRDAGGGRKTGSFPEKRRASY